MSRVREREEEYLTFRELLLLPPTPVKAYHTARLLSQTNTHTPSYTGAQFPTLHAGMGEMAQNGRSMQSLLRSTKTDHLSELFLEAF